MHTPLPLWVRSYRFATVALMSAFPDTDRIIGRQHGGVDRNEVTSVARGMWLSLPPSPLAERHPQPRFIRWLCEVPKIHSLNRIER
jgi:hypothetical protein